MPNADGWLTDHERTALRYKVTQDVCNSGDGEIDMTEPYYIIRYLPDEYVIHRCDNRTHQGLSRWIVNHNGLYLWNDQPHVHLAIDLDISELEGQRILKLIDDYNRAEMTSTETLSRLITAMHRFNKAEDADKYRAICDRILAGTNADRITKDRLKTLKEEALQNEKQSSNSKVNGS